MATTVNRAKKEEKKVIKPAKVGKKIVFVETKEEIKKPIVDISDLEFFSCKWSRTCDKRADVSITDTKRGIRFIFRNKVYDKFTSEHVEFAIWKNKDVYKRIYIRDNKNGIKIVKAAKNTRFVSVNNNIKQAKILREFLGDYKLKFDEEIEIYYIEK